MGYQSSGSIDVLVVLSVPDRSQVTDVDAAQYVCVGSVFGLVSQTG